MSSGTSYLRIQTWGMFLETLLFGFYLVTFCACFRVFFLARSQRRPGALCEMNWPMLILFVLFLAKTTSSVVLHLHLNLCIASAVDPMDAVRQLRSSANPLNISKYTTSLIEVVLGSGFLVYRCWLVYKRNYPVILLPVLLCIGGTVVMCLVVRIDSIHKVDGILAQSRTLGAVFWGIFLAVNLITTALIAYRTQHRFVPHDDLPVENASASTSPTKRPLPRLLHAPNRVKQAKDMVVESGLIYTTSLLLTFALFVANTEAVYAAIDVLVQAIGITFNLIVGHSREENHDIDAEHELHSLDQRAGVSLRLVSTESASRQSSGIEFAFPTYFDPRRNGQPAQQQSNQGSWSRATGLSATPATRGNQ
ncbi:hypothetical protein C8F01DRAFT_695780 [Mycena amicta]|nr:hypothetical protein C8F01DRAFT_695780 [Mycena amicta]